MMTAARPMTRVCLVAAPLTARSGVYRSARELVNEARSQGLDWSLVLGVSAKAKGQRPSDDPSWIQEFVAEPSGIGGIAALKQRLLSVESVASSDVVISLIPQTDMALSLTSLNWIAYVRGLPWPEGDESSKTRGSVWQMLERLALRRARDVWSTTPLLRAQLALRREVSLVPAGLEPMPRLWDGAGDRKRVVWAARFDTDKNPWLFLDAMRGTALQGVMYGSGPLEEQIRAAAPHNVEVVGWVDPSALWSNALAYVGTSHREAFGRSAVEASMAGIPVVLADTFGSAALLVRDAELAARFVLPTAEVQPWSDALNDLATDEDLRRDLSNHIAMNARELTVSGSVGAIRARLALVAADRRRN